MHSDAKDGAYPRVAFIGEVDHGKSSLLARLTRLQDHARRLPGRQLASGDEGELAHDVDQLTEERDQNMTIDTTEVRVALRGRTFGLIDAPGHLELLRNMATGAARAEASILVVDVTAGVRAQTLRHLATASVLGSREIIVAVNKMDAVDYDQAAFAAAVAEVHAACPAGGAWRTAPVAVPVSARTGVGVTSFGDTMGWHTGPTLVDALLTLTPSSAGELPASLAVQDVYELDGAPWIVGRVTSGTLRRGMRLRISGLEVEHVAAQLLRYPEQVETAGAGESIALCLASPEGHRRVETTWARRGDVIHEATASLRRTRAIAGGFVWLDEAPLALGDAVELRCATQRLDALVTAIVSLDGDRDPAKVKAMDSVAYGQAVRIDLALEEDMVTGAQFDQTDLGRLVLTRAGRLVAGGQVK